MTDTTITDAEAYPMDDGSGVSDGDENYNSAAWQALMARYKGDGSYIGEDTSGNATLQFNDVDTTNEEVDVGSGYAYITESGHSVQSRPQTTYDTNVPIGVPYVALLPTEVTNLGLGTDTGNDLWLAIDPTAASDPVYIRHGSGLSAPSDPSVKLGTVNTSTGSTTRANDLSTDTHDQTTVNILTANTRANTPELNGGVTGNSALTNIAGDNLTIDGSGNLDAAAGLITNTVSSNTTTSDEDLIAVNTSGGAVTITLASADVTNGNSIVIVHVDGSNAVTVDTEGGETIDPDGDSSKTINNAGDSVRFTGDGTNWDSSLAPEFDSVTTESATIGGGRVFERFDRQTPGSDQTEIQFTGLSNDAEYRLVFAGVVDHTSGTEQVRIRINDDGNSTGDYEYFDETGTKQTSENEYLVFDYSGALRASFAVWLNQSVFGGNGKLAIGNDYVGGELGNIEGFAQTGGRGNSTALNSIEVQTDTAFSGGDSVIELWERDYS